MNLGIAYASSDEEDVAQDAKSKVNHAHSSKWDVVATNFRISQKAVANGKFPQSLLVDSAGTVKTDTLQIPPPRVRPFQALHLGH